MKKNKVREDFLEQLRKVPIVQVACEKAGLSRNTVYRWRKEDESFKGDMDVALVEGDAFISDMSESQVVSMIREKNWQAISFWLKHRSPRYREKVEVTAKIESDVLTPEQEALVKKALLLGAFSGNQNDSHE